MGSGAPEGKAVPDPHVTPQPRYYTPTHRVGAILQSPCPSVRPFVCPFVRPSVHTFVTDFSASTGRNDFIFDIWLWHGDLYRVSPFQVYRTSTSCLQCNLEFFMFAVMKTFVTVMLASTGRNDFIFDIWLWHGDLYRVSPFQVYHTSTSCLPCDLQMNEWGYSQHDLACNILFFLNYLQLYLICFSVAVFDDSRYSQ